MLCDSLLLENESLKEIECLSKDLVRYFGSHVQFHHIWTNKKFTLDKDALGYLPKKGKEAFTPKQSIFLKSNVFFEEEEKVKMCHKCKAKVEVNHQCKTKKTISLDTCSNLYLGIYQAEIEKAGRTVRGSGLDCPAAPSGPSAWVVGRRGGTGRSGANNGSSAPGCRTVRAPRGPFAGASQTVRACRTQVGPTSRGDKSATLLSLSQTARGLPPSLFLALSQGKGPLLGDFDSSTPRTVRAHSRTLREILHHVIRVFFRISHSLSQILSKKVLRV
jgi:hypothetical protein